MRGRGDRGSGHSVGGGAVQERGGEAGAGAGHGHVRLVVREAVHGGPVGGSMGGRGHDGRGRAGGLQLMDHVLQRLGDAGYQGAEEC